MSSPLLDERLVDGEEITDRRLRRGRQLAARAQEVVVGVVVREVDLPIRPPVPVHVERNDADAVPLDHLARQILRGVGDDREPWTSPPERIRFDRTSADAPEMSHATHPDVVGSKPHPRRRAHHEVPRDHLQRRVAVRGRDAGRHRGDVRGARRVRRGGRQGGRVRRRRGPAAGRHGDHACACATASGCSPTARTPRPRSSSAATTCSSARTSTTRSTGRRGSPRPRRGAVEVRPVMDYDAMAGASPRGAESRRLLTGPQNVLVDRLFRRESGQAVAVLARILGDLDRAEEAVQDAFLTALERWPRDGLPDNPRGLDRHRGAQPRARPDPLREALGGAAGRARGRAARRSAAARTRATRTRSP